MQNNIESVKTRTHICNNNLYLRIIDNSKFNNNKLIQLVGSDRLVCPRLRLFLIDKFVVAIGALHDNVVCGLTKPSEGLSNNDTPLKERRNDFVLFYSLAYLMQRNFHSNFM